MDPPRHIAKLHRELVGLSGLLPLPDPVALRPTLDGARGRGGVREREREREGQSSSSLMTGGDEEWTPVTRVEDDGARSTTGSTPTDNLSTSGPLAASLADVLSIGTAHRQAQHRSHEVLGEVGGGGRGKHRMIGMRQPVTLPLSLAAMTAGGQLAREDHRRTRYQGSNKRTPDRDTGSISAITALSSQRRKVPKPGETF